MPNEIAQAEVEVEDTQKKKKIIGAGIVVLIIIILVGAFLWQSKQGGERVREVAVAVSVPLRLSLGRDIMNSITLAFEEAGYKAGDVKVNLIPFDGGDESGAWQEDLEVKNAEQAAANGSVVAYIGTYNSGAAKISMPILNRAGIVQVSPGNTWPGLTKEGFLPGEPGRFYPTGLRHYVRVVTTDDLQGPAGAIWAKELGFNSVYILDDGESYGKGVADLFRTRAQDIGLTVLKQVTIDKKGTDFTHEILDIKQLNPDLIYYGGITPNGITHLLSQARNAGVESAFMGPDGILESDFILRTGVENAEGVYATTVGVLPIDIGTPESAVYYAAYIERFGEEPGVFGAFGYEAAQVVLAGIENAEIKDRAGVLQEIKRTADFEGLFEKWSFDENGDTSLKLMSGNIVHDGKYEYVETLLVP
jgi:branched-chain amino acid transport system substrate-binding protein